MNSRKDNLETCLIINLKTSELFLIPVDSLILINEAYAGSSNLIISLKSITSFLANFIQL